MALFSLNYVDHENKLLPCYLTKTKYIVLTSLWGASHLYWAEPCYLGLAVLLFLCTQQNPVSCKEYIYCKKITGH